MLFFVFFSMCKSEDSSLLVWFLAILVSKYLDIRVSMQYLNVTFNCRYYVNLVILAIRVIIAKISTRNPIMNQFFIM